MQAVEESVERLEVDYQAELLPSPSAPGKDCNKIPDLDLEVMSASHFRFPHEEVKRECMYLTADANCEKPYRS